MTLIVKKAYFIQTLSSIHIQIVIPFGEEVNLELVLKVLVFRFNNNLLQSLLGIDTILFHTYYFT